MLEPFENEAETLDVESFLSLESASISLRNISAFIGPQASGKSVIAKLFFFGRSYLSHLFQTCYYENFDLRSFKSDQISVFLALFGGLQGFVRPFSVTYTLDHCTVVIERSTPTGKIKISHSKSIDSTIGKLKRAFRNFSAAMDRGTRRSIRPRGFDFEKSEDATPFFDTLPDVLFVPASRSFYSAVSEELFTFLASDERVDPLTAQFGSFYEFAKRRLSGELFGGSRGAIKTDVEKQKLLLPVLGGEFFRENSVDFIRTNWGKVALRSASSGQQEALPLLMSIIEFPTRLSQNQLLIIEEPEAHLYPSSQKYVLDLILKQALEHTCDVILTTHSPFVLACLNTHIARAKNDVKNGNGNASLNAGAWLADQGAVSDMRDSDGFVDLEELDQTSENIANEFMEALGGRQ